MKTLPDDQKGCQPRKHQVDHQFPLDGANFFNATTDLEHFVAVNQAILVSKIKVTLCDKTYFQYCSTGVMVWTSVILSLKARDWLKGRSPSGLKHLSSAQVPFPNGVEGLG